MYKFDLLPPEDDGLFIPPDVGPWSADKHYFLRRYMHAFTAAMKPKPWQALHYIDLFACAGIERLEGGRLEWGSPLIAAQSPVPFHQLHLIEEKKINHDALAQRLQRFPQPSEPRLLLGDANVRVSEIIEHVPSNALSLAFLDPYGLHLDYATLKVLAQRRVDLIIFFPDYLDAVRNAGEYYEGDPDSNLTRVLGTDEWETALHGSRPGQKAEIFRQVYFKQIEALGYRYCDFERIRGRDGHPLYVLIFCCRHEVGLKIWRGIVQKKRDGQWTMF